MSGMVDPTPTVDAPSKPAQRFRRTRIAASVFFAVLTVALCALWVRSYSRSDSCRVFSVGVISNLGQLFFWNAANQTEIPNGLMSGLSDQGYIGRLQFLMDLQMSIGFGIADDGKETIAVFPFWFFVLLAGAASAIPWFAFRFSVRTMFIATTLVAVALGLGVWLAS
jgi:hypothetical protein